MDLALWLRMMGVCLKSGLPLHEAMVVSGLPDGVSRQSAAGESLGTVLESDNRVTGSLAAVLASAEKLGSLQIIFEKYGKLYYQFALIRQRWIVSRLVPVLLTVCALITALAVFAGYHVYFNTLNDAAGMLEIW